MKYETAAAFRTALEQRLQTHSRETRVPLGRLRKQIAFDRLLARLLKVAPNRWVLKGALALDFRLGTQTRTTKDMDLAYRSNEKAATADLIKAQGVNLSDFFIFAIERVGKLGDADEGTSVRYHVRAELAGRTFEEITLDVGFYDPLLWEPDRLQGFDLLRFAGIEPIKAPVVPLEQQVAEKVHAYTRIYAGARPSTRVKDLVDLALIARSARLNARRLSQALRITFEARGRQPLPQALPMPPTGWGPAYRKLAMETEVELSLEAGYAEAAAFLDPILSGVAKGQWNPNRRTWSS